MALIGEIRKNSWLLIILIGLGLAAFIMMDMFSGDKSLFGGQQTSAGNINGKNISMEDFNRTENTLYNNAGDVFDRRKRVWDYYVEDALLQEEASALGLSVGGDELRDLQFGAQANMSPIIQQSFRNPQTGQVDMNTLNSFKKQVEDNTITGPQRDYWAEQEKLIIKDRLQSKLTSLVTKGMYTPTWMVEQTHADGNQSLSFDYVKIPFDEVDDSAVKVTDGDLNTYINNNAALYSQDVETRKVDYVTFDVLPTPSDSAEIRTKLNELKGDFQSTSEEEMADFVSINSGVYQDAFYTKEQLGDTANDNLFSASVGSVVGPYVSGKAYTMVKILDRRVLPDSAKSRHILISAQNDAQFAQAERTIDSLQNLIETGKMRFDSLAVKFSQDPGSAAKGGLYENVGINQFVPEFRDVIFYAGQRGKLYKVKTNYGYHLIEPMGRTLGANKEYVRIATINEPIVPSEDTQDELLEQVEQLVINNRTIDALRTVITQQGYAEEISPAFKENDYILGTLGSGQTSRKIIKWAFDEETNIGEVSPEVYSYQEPNAYHDSKYIIAALRSTQAPGKPSLANIKEDIMPLVMNQKKAAVIKGKVAGQNLQGVASSYGSEIENVAGANFSSGFITGLGNEPKVVAAAHALNAGQVSEPVAGDNGVYIVKLNEKTAAAAPNNIPQLRKSATADISNYIQANLMNSLKKKANIEDNRSTFY